MERQEIFITVLLITNSEFKLALILWNTSLLMTRYVTNAVEKALLHEPIYNTFWIRDSQRRRRISRHKMVQIFSCTILLNFAQKRETWGFRGEDSYVLTPRSGVSMTPAFRRAMLSPTVWLPHDPPKHWCPTTQL